MENKKFRYWDKNKKAYIENMVNGIALAITDDGVVLLNTIDGLWRDTSFVAEQFILIKDKNGKEIYEGDWLDIVDPNGEKMDDSQCVFYDDDGGYFIEDDFKMLPIGYAIKEGYEITVNGNKNQED